jgi:hypothetical protein
VAQQNRTNQRANSKTIWNLRDVPPSAFRLPTDGRKCRAVCDRRRALVQQLASYGDEDGTNIWPGRKALAKALGISIREVGYLLADLAALEFLRNDGWHVSGNSVTRIRSLDLEAIFRAAAHGQNRPISAHGQNREAGRIELQHGQNSSGTRPPLDLPKKQPPPAPLFSKGGSNLKRLLTLRQVRELRDQITLAQREGLPVLAAIEEACKRMLFPVEAAIELLAASGHQERSEELRTIVREDPRKPPRSAIA